MFRRVMVVIVAAIATCLTALAVIRTVFSSLGEPVGGNSWSYIVALILSLGIAGGCSGVRITIPPQFDRVAFVLSGMASGTFLGFVYAGLSADKNPQIATIGGILGGVVMGFICWRWRRGVVAMVVAIAGAVTGYGLAFWLWTVAIAYFTAQQLVWGIILSAISLVYIALTMSSLVLALVEMKGNGLRSHHL
jgi:hypothetical protein